MSLVTGLFFLLISSIIGAFSTLLFKTGSRFKISIRNNHLIGAVVLAAFSFVFYILALQQAPLTFIYLTASISYIWAIILAKSILKEKINRNKIIGVSLIIIGIVVLNFPF